MANKHANSEITPANTDDALEGPQRIREIKQAYNERLSRDHLVGGSSYTSGDVLASGADSYDSGYHRRLTIKEESTDQGSASDTRLNASSTGINHGTTAKMAEIWVEKSSTTGNETSIRFLGTESTGNERTVVSEDQTQTLTNKTMTAPILNDATLSGGAGAIDGVAIGQRAAAAGPPAVLAGAAAGKFTTLESTDDTVIGNADTDTLTLKAATNGLSSDAGGTTGANLFYAGLAGEIKMYAGASLPAGWLWCDGAEYTKVAKAELYAVIGDAYNAPGNSTSSSTYANYISNSSYFRVPDLRGRTPVGSGTGNDSHTAAGASGLHPSDDLTARTLGDYGANETHTLAAGESGAGPHYHVTEPVEHNHDIETGAEGYKYVLRRRNDGLSTVATVDTTVGEPDLATSKALVANSATIKAGHKLNVAGTTETTAQGADSDDVFRTGKTNLNTGVPAASAHTQMQPWLAINYIIKY